MFSTFSLQLHASDALVVILAASSVGLLTLALGYGSTVIIGGLASLKLAEFIAWITRSKHAVEVIDEEPKTLRYRIVQDTFMLYVPALVFVMSVILGWDIHNLHDPNTIFHPLVHALDFFSKPTTVDPISYSVDVIPAMLILIAITGIVTSVTVPYLRQFKIIGVNNGPFHMYLVYTVMGFVVGLGTLLTLLGLIYGVFWAGNGPYYYHYVIPTMFGLSLHYAAGSFWGREKSEELVKARLEKSSSKRIVQGTVNIEELT
jgi:hypothetical protein